jgi:hypothetical protein
MARLASAAAWSIVAALVAALPGHAIGAEIRVLGSENAVWVDARDATRDDILAALATRFALRYRGATDSRRQTATFAGSLRQVVRRVLAGYNYTININRKDGVLEVFVVSPESNVAVPPPRPIPRGRQE